MATTLTESDRAPRKEPLPEVPYEGWANFTGGSLSWYQGEHVTILAPTGWGKTTLGYALLPLRRFVIVIATKPEDPSLDALVDSGYKVTRENLLPPSVYPRQIFWPRLSSAKDVPKQRYLFADVMEKVYRQGRWTIYFDELDYVCNFLKLAPLVELLWRQGRSLKVSVVGGTQRPAFIPLLAYDQSTHLFIGRDNDEVNLQRYGKLAGGRKSLRGRTLMHTVMELPKRGQTWGDFAYVNTRDGSMLRTSVDIEGR